MEKFGLILAHFWLVFGSRANEPTCFEPSHEPKVSEPVTSRASSEPKVSEPPPSRAFSELFSSLVTSRAEPSRAWLGPTPNQKSHEKSKSTLH